MEEKFGDIIKTSKLKMFHNLKKNIEEVELKLSDWLPTTVFAEQHDDESIANKPFIYLE